MKNKILILMAMMAVMVLLSAIQAVAPTSTIAVLGPNATTFIGGTILLRAEVNGSGFNHSGAGNPSTANITGVTWEYSTDGGTTWYVATTNRTNVNNGSLSNSTANLNTLNLSDSNVTRWRALAQNGTDGNNTRSTSAEIAAVTVDNTIPVISFASSANTVFSTDLATFTTTGINASTCRLKFGTDNRLDFAMTKSSDTCTYILNKDTLPDETYAVTFTASDGTNSTINALSFVIALRSEDAISGNIDSKVVTQVAQTAQQKAKQKNMLIIAAVIIIALMLNNKKGGLFK